MKIKDHIRPYRYTKEEIISLLQSQGADLDRLYKEADALRKKYMGDEVYIRGIIEFSNICANDCLYCGIRASNHFVNRYTMTPEEIMETVKTIESTHMVTTVVLQSGETPGLTDKEIGRMIIRIKKETNLAVTLSVGNRDKDTYKFWRDCGMDRYLLRFETSDKMLFERLHPDCSLKERIECLYELKDLGVQTGSGFMIGIPGENLGTLADNILLCRHLELDMIGIGPFIPHPDTPLGMTKNAYDGDKDMFFKAIAVLRIFNPDSHIPATTAFDTIFPGEGRVLALKRGANVYMPNFTPIKYRKEYFLYPDKPYVDESNEATTMHVVSMVKSIGRKIGKGLGNSIRGRRS
ncbi:MAG TPA: [FeFe] hydrogenase H-cluster radical SAM maturase HydE [Syntrophorhabdaceae bacterium]|nr:[FeFe] hydrogenase H-cluster radical SAM maturase HydE [Syntrophorhabdaceae bacterium]